MSTVLEEKIEYKYSRWENYSITGSGFYEEMVVEDEGCSLGAIQKIVYQERIIKKWQGIVLTNFWLIWGGIEYAPNWRWRVVIETDSKNELEKYMRSFFTEKMYEKSYFFCKDEERKNWNCVKKSREDFLITKYNDRVKYIQKVKSFDIGLLMYSKSDGRRRAILVEDVIYEKLKSIKREWRDGSWLKFDFQQNKIIGELTFEVRKEFAEKK